MRQMAKPLSQVRFVAAVIDSSVNLIGDKITAHSDGTFRVWDAKAAPAAIDPADHACWVQAVIFSRDGRLLATAGDLNDKSVKIWDAISGKLLHTLLGHDVGINSLSFSPDGSKLASGSGDKTARIWDIESGTTTIILSGHDGLVKQIDFSEDGRQVISRTDEKTYVWDLEHPQTPASTILGEDSTIVAVNPDLGDRDKEILISMEDGHWLFMGSGSDKRPVGAVPEEFRVSGFLFHSDSDRVAIVDVSGPILILDISRLKKEFQE